MSSIKVRRAVIADSEIIAKIAWQSFDEAFSDHPANDPEDMKVYMEEAFAAATIRSEIADAQNVYLIADFDDRVAGYAKIRFDAREPGVTGGKTLELCRLYALDEFIGKGIGKSLMLEIFAIAESTERDSVWLGVWEFNYRAQEFYKRFGFEKCGEHIFQLGSDPQTDWLFEKHLGDRI